MIFLDFYLSFRKELCLTLLFLILVPFLTFSQSRVEIDSLLEASYSYYSDQQYLDGIGLAEKSIALSQVENYEEGKVKGEFYLLISQQELDPSKYDPKPIEALFEDMDKLGLDKIKARSHTFLAGVYAFFGDLEKSIANHLLAIKIYENSNDQNGLSSVYSNLSLVYYDQGDYEEAFYYIRKSLQISTENPGSNDLHATINNLAIIFEKTGPIDSAIFYHQMALEEAQKNKDAYSVGLSLSNLGNNYAANGQLDLAEKTLLEALSIRDSIGYSRGLAYTHNRLANLYLETNKPSKAKFHAEQSLAHAEKSSEVKVLRMAYERLQEVAQKTGDYRAELNYLKKASALKDSILNESNTKSITQLMLNYEFEKKHLIDSLKNEQEKQERDLGFVERLEAAQSRQILLLISVLLFLALAVGLFHRNQFIKKSTRIITKEKEKSDKLLLNILPEAVAEELKEKGYSEARDFEEVTVIFTDFVDFTKKAQHLSAKELVTELNTCFKAFDQIVVDCGLEKIKTIGDAYMAAGGLNMKAKAKEVAVAAIRMKEFIDQRNNDPELSEKIKFDMRCGINTGPVAAGIVGIKKFQYDIWGDTVNTAQRMEANCEINNINVSENTYQLIKDVSEFTFEARGLLSVKGKGKMSMWYLRKKTFSNG